MLMLNERMNEYVNKYSQKTWVVFVQGSFSQGGVLVRMVFVQVVFVRGGFCPYTSIHTGSLNIDSYLMLNTLPQTKPDSATFLDAVNCVTIL